MNTATPLTKARLLAHLDTQDALGAFSDEAFEELGRLVEAIRADSPVSAPMDAQDRVEGRWETLFAHFGAKHSAGKPKVHDSNLKVHSFNRFPPIPVRITRLCQEIAREGAVYSNVVDFTAADGVTRGVIIVHGRYRDESENRQRFTVDFHRVELRAAEGFTETQLRTALGLTQGEPLAEDLKPPRLHSDVIYLDDDTRINVGSLGGLYVLRRLAEPLVSVASGA